MPVPALEPAAAPVSQSATAARGSVFSKQPRNQAGNVLAPVPEGFFSDKQADAKIRGVKLPDQKDREREFQVRDRLKSCPMSA